MGLLDLVRSGVAIANSLTTELQGNVTHKVLAGIDGAGKRTYVTVIRKAIVTRIQKLVKTSSGQMVMSTSQIVFLDPGVIINELDQIVLADGTSGPILTSNGFMDAGTGHPILTEVFLG